MAEDYNLTVRSERALNDAKDIENIVQRMEDNMNKLDSTINACIADGEGDTGILTNWSSTVKENWKKYSTNDVPTTFANMKESAKNLKVAVDRAEAFSNERA